ncbi:iron uptake transporter deferrochelatase/peroxidase subunit [Streptomyces sp. NPDC058369]|uniref:iron uptake transporter deferrochelatase/peroxidase subunit n=1 Tax=unclassified Streptomyces TaxID=2593676 RepID=UPI00224FB266|nr:iron uptake transporter deferrochelatase/peroxidase subunit [Streptomyces sp. NBC_01789]MCX4448001.1 iron uptake transporter deferrochelatase/peroxidase subunit [Streptomyces sp. NBC_01789]
MSGNSASNDNSKARAVSRRRLLGTAGAAGATGLVLGAAGGATGYAMTRDEAPTALTAVGSTEVMFHGKHQPGITTPLQARGHLIAFDLAPGAGRKQAAALMRRWSAVAQRLMAGEPTGGAADGPGHDTGVALDAGPSSLTVTFGFGATFFERTGLVAHRPPGLDPLPPFSSDHLDAGRSNGDLWVQIGADDALVAFHALRAVQKEAVSTASVRWQMNGFNRTPGATAKPMTARNLMGQIDGTGNPKPTDGDFDKRVFVPGGQDAAYDWLAGGSYAVVRRIRMLLDDWEKLPVERQERVIGRRKADGAPLSGGTETTAMDLDKAGPDGKLLIPDNAHARISSPERNSGAAMLRRPFSYHDGISSDGTPDAGLLFICWQADPLRGFVPVQRKLDRGDALSPFLRHESSGLFAVPGGAPDGEYVGQRLLES